MKKKQKMLSELASDAHLISTFYDFDGNRDSHLLIL
jgi:hypothetical protein